MSCFFNFRPGDYIRFKDGTDGFITTVCKSLESGSILCLEVDHVWRTLEEIEAWRAL